jgi:hypothetical protein
LRSLAFGLAPLLPPDVQGEFQDLPFVIGAPHVEEAGLGRSVKVLRAFVTVRSSPASVCARCRSGVKPYGLRSRTKGWTVHRETAVSG